MLTATSEFKNRHVSTLPLGQMLLTRVTARPPEQYSKPEMAFNGITVG